MRRFLSIALLTCLCFVANAARAAEVDDIIHDENGIAYQVTSLDPAEVQIARQDQNGGVTAGEIVVPPTVAYDGTEYSVTSIAASAFVNSTITLIELPEGIKETTSILATNSTSLTTLILPSTLESLSRTTTRCTALATIVCYAATPPTLPSNSSGALTPFTGSTITTLYVPSASVDTYKASDWAGVVTENILPVDEADIIIATNVPFTDTAVGYSAGTNYFYFVIPDDAVSVTISGISALYSDDECTTQAATGTDNGDGTYTYAGLTFGDTYYGKIEASSAGSITATYQGIIVVPVADAGEAVDYSAGTSYFSFDIPGDALSVTISGIGVLYSDMQCTTSVAEGTDNGDGTYTYTGLTTGATYYGTLTAFAAGTVTATYFAKNTVVHDGNGVAYLVTSLDPAEVSLAVQGNNGKTSGDVVIPAAVTYDGTEYTVTRTIASAFEDTDITSVNYEASEVTSTGSDMFTNCQSLVSATIGEGCSLGTDMFYACYALEYVDLPSTCTKIPRQWLYIPSTGNASSMTTFICRAVTPPELAVSVVGDVVIDPLPSLKNVCTLYVPEASVDDYKASDWANYFNIIEPIEATLVSSAPEADTDNPLEFTKGEDFTVTLTFSSYVTLDANQSYINTYKAFGWNTALGGIAATGDTDGDGCSKTWAVTVSSETLSALANVGNLPLVLYVTNHLGTLYNGDGYCMLTYYYSLIDADNSEGEGEGGDTTGIGAVAAAIANGAEVYNLAGQKVTTPIKGTVSIIKYADGTVKKMLRK